MIMKLYNRFKELRYMSIALVWYYDKIGILPIYPGCVTITMIVLWFYIKITKDKG